MKLGAENPKKVAITAILLVFALGLFVYVIFDKSSPEFTSGSGMKRPQVTLKTGASYGLDPSLRTDLLKSSEHAVYASTEHNIFVAKPDPPPPPTCAPLGGPGGGLKWCKPIEVASQPPPPPITLSFFGFASKPGEPKKAFLSQGEDIFVAS